MDGVPTEIPITAWEQGFDAAGQHLLTAKQPVRYETILGGEPKVIFLGESHPNSAIHRELQNQARELKKAGVSAFLVEANSNQEDLFRLVNSGNFSRVSETDLGPMNREQRILMVQALQREGIEILPIDDPRNYKKKERADKDTQEREEYIARKIGEIAASRDGKITVLIGLNHATRGSSHAIDFLERDGVSCKSVFFTGGSDQIPKIVTESAKRVGIGYEKFMFQATGKNAPYGGKADLIVHLPQVS